MAAEQQKEQRIQFFGRSGELVCPVFANRWTQHGVMGRGQGFSGEGKTLALDVQTSLRYYVVEHVILYSDEYTKQSWPQTPTRIRRNDPSRSAEIDQLEAGEVICYPFHAHSILYAKTVGAENIQLDTLRACDNFGNPLPGDENLLTASRIAPLIGLTKDKDNNRAQLTPFDFRGSMTFLLAVGSAEISEERLRRFGEEMFGDINTGDNSPTHSLTN